MQDELNQDGDFLKELARSIVRQAMEEEKDEPMGYYLLQEIMVKEKKIGSIC